MRAKTLTLIKAYPDFALFACLLVVLFPLLPPEDFGYAAGRSPFRHLSFFLSHGNVLHLALNLIGLYYALRAVRPVLRHPFLSLPWAVLVSTLACAFDPSEVYVVGASALISALIGAYIYAHVVCRIRFASPFFRARFSFLIASFIFYSGILPHISLFGHVVPMALGFLLGGLLIEPRPERGLFSSGASRSTRQAEWAEELLRLLSDPDRPRDATSMACERALLAALRRLSSKH
ncbi:MAG: rhomboid family intramembrane serine protease [Porphyromonas sp.]|nr:rhomboid family intramembrane serine protease [Bacteroidales bacterium]MDY3101412.1 rhomboid family intramembrane serine protease [Porphyromonas sp.]